MQLNVRAKINMLTPDTPISILEQYGLVETLPSNIGDSYDDILCVRFLCFKYKNHSVSLKQNKSVRRIMGT